MNEYEANLAIEELLKLIARFKMDNASLMYENRTLKEDVESLRKEVARLEAVAAEEETAKAS